MTREETEFQEGLLNDGTIVCCDCDQVFRTCTCREKARHLLKAPPPESCS